MTRNDLPRYLVILRGPTMKLLGSAGMLPQFQPMIVIIAIIVVLLSSNVDEFDVVCIHS
jgi:hypothetical protein